jgi:hypothetical protein
MTRKFSTAILGLLVVVLFSNSFVFAQEDTTVDVSELPRLRDYDESEKEIIEELVDEGLISGDGLMLFRGENAFYEGVDTRFAAIAPGLIRQDVVIGTQIRFRTSSSREYDDEDFESCGIMLRAEIERNARGRESETYSVFSIINNTEGTLLDLSEVFNTDIISESTVEADFDVDRLEDEAINVLIVAVEEQITVFLDGVPTVGFTVDEPIEGGYGLLANGVTRNMRCQFNNFWVYEIYQD